MKGNSNLNTSGIYWLYINPWVCSHRNQTSTTMYLLFNTKLNQKKNTYIFLSSLGCWSWQKWVWERRNDVGKEFNWYLYWCSREHFWGVCSHSVLKWDMGMCTHVFQGLVSPVSVWAGQKLWHWLKKSLISTSKGIRSHSIPHTIPLANLNRDWEIKVLFLSE